MKRGIKSELKSYNRVIYPVIKSISIVPAHLGMLKKITGWRYYDHDLRDNERFPKKLHISESIPNYLYHGGACRNIYLYPFPRHPFLHKVVFLYNPSRKKAYLTTLCYYQSQDCRKVCDVSIDFHHPVSSNYFEMDNIGPLNIVIP